MLFLVRNIKYGGCRYWDFLERWKALGNVASNLKSGVNSKSYRTRVELQLPDDRIKNYLEAVTKSYSQQLKDKEFGYLVQVREIVDLLENRIRITENILSLTELAHQDEEFKKMSREEHAMYMEQLGELDDELLGAISQQLIQDNCRDILFEVTAGVGGSEAMMFTSDLVGMYQKYFDRLGFAQEIIDIGTDNGVGGMRHATIHVSGDRAFECLRHEGGVHRVQRVPATEKSGRMHTSTVIVAVLPQPSEIEVDIKDKDLKIETKTSSAPGGQNVNRIDSAVRITHLPTGIVVEAQTDRSQIKNKKIAMMKLRTKIYERQLNDQKAETDSLRRRQKGMGTRNEKIRTYNFNQDRITDHRISHSSMHNLRGFLDNGQGLETLQEKLQRQFQIKILQETIETWK